MNRTQPLYLLVAALTFLTAIAMLFFAATDNKNAVGLSAVAVFFALISIFWIYRFTKERRIP